MPALGLTRTRARISGSPGTPSGPRAIDPGAERLAGDPLIGLDVLLARARDDVVGDRRRRRGAGPAGRGSPSPADVLAKGGLTAARFVLVRRPEARGVRGAHLIADGQLPIGVEA